MSTEWQCPKCKLIWNERFKQCVCDGSSSEREARLERIVRRVANDWLPYPENKPLPGWCATTDGGDIRLVMWTNFDRWAEEDRGVIEFMQVTVNA